MSKWFGFVFAVIVWGCPYGVQAQSAPPPDYHQITEVSGPLANQGIGIARVFENDQGRRGLLLLQKTEQGEIATGWGYVIPCRLCGIDLDGEHNFSLSIVDQAVQIVDRSESKEQGSRTHATLTLRFDADLAQWRLAQLQQMTSFYTEGKALQSTVNYLTGETRDVEGILQGRVFIPKRIQVGTVDDNLQTLESLSLY